MKDDFCQECGIGLNNSEIRLGFCQNCKAHWEKEEAVPISSLQPKEESDEVELWYEAFAMARSRPLWSELQEIISKYKLSKRI